MTQQCKDYFPNSPIVTAIKSHEAKTPGTANCRNGTADCKCQEGKTWCIANYIATMGERLGCRK